MSEINFHSRNALSEDWKIIKKIYKNSFPLFERKPFFMVKSKVQSGQSDAIVFLQGNDIVGFASTLIYKNLVLLDYFAIDKAYRSCGYGSAALQCLFKKYSGKKIILTAEEPNPKAANSIQREKRLQFYFKNSMKDNSFKMRAFADMRFCVLSYPETVTQDEFMSVHYNVMGTFFTKLAGINPCNIN